MAYVENRFIGKSSRLIADITEITGVLNKEGFLVTMDINKAFDSLDHTFVISILRKFGFGNNFVSWIETLIVKQESCTISYYPVLSSWKRGLPRWPYFGLYLYPCFRSIIFFWLEIKTWKVSIFLIIFFLYTAYAGNTMFFLENKESIEELVKNIYFVFFLIRFKS